MFEQSCFCPLFIGAVLSSRTLTLSKEAKSSICLFLSPLHRGRPFLSSII